ncbi:MAG: hypothetical protein EA396_10900 [Anaerolineaceae bacterium]|nr:MAG: hypothetical protein EA396_10900 [Anaerolineaceae bacterium]
MPHNPRSRLILHELAVGALLLLLPLILFLPQTLGGKTLIPSENLYQYPPFSTYAAVVGAPPPHNALVDDLILQNYQWKSFIRRNIADGEIPLWNPHQFSGQPFMALGQQSTLYPLSVLYYVLPLDVAYGWFTVLNLWLAGWLMYALLRGLHQARIGGLVAGITYQLSAFFVASAVHPMIVAAGVWLPLLLLMAEFIIRGQTLIRRPAMPLWIVVGAGALTCNILAGHPELTIYTLLITAFYAGLRLLWQARHSAARDVVVRSAGVAGMVALGFALGAVQFLPLYEAASVNWRAERGSLADVLNFAHPARDVLMYAMPNFYGNPTHHSYFDWFTLERVAVTVNSTGDAINHTAWGIKNYVEGALYVGILPLALALLALVDAWAGRRRDDPPTSPTPPYRLIFAALVLLAGTFMFGLPTYALIYPLPGVNQLNTAFRWVFAVSAGVAVLAGFGASALAAGRSGRAARLFAWGWWLVGGGVLAGLAVSRLLYERIEGVVETLFNNMALANTAFESARAFYSYQFTNALIFALIALGVGVVFRLALWRREPTYWGALAVVLLAADLMIASAGFNPASDPRLLDFEPPAVTWLQEQKADQPFRYITLEDPSGGLDRMFQANTTMRYGLDDVRGYDSIISADYVAYMRGVQIQPQLDFNRIAPLYLDRVAGGEVDWARLDRLNVRYIVTHAGIAVPDDLLAERLTPVYADEAVVIYQNAGAFPRVYLASQIDPPDNVRAARVIGGTSRETIIEVDGGGDPSSDWLVFSMAYDPGWRAFVRPQGVDAFGDPAEERQLTVERADGIFQAVRWDAARLAEMWSTEPLSAEQQAAIDDGRYVVRFIYSPTSFQVGAFASAIGGASALFLLGLWLWGLLVGAGKADARDVSLVARNSIAPIALNLFNRGIDFAFALVMLRILGPEDAGIYYYAIVVFVWFDIFTNFGLDVFVIREVSRERLRALFYLLNSSYLRLFLMVLCVPVLIGFLAIRQATIEPALTNEALMAIGLLYIGLAPASISKGLTGIFYAFQKAEYPAAVTTITTINKAVLGVIALLLGYGIVGLAAVSIVVNLITVSILGVAAWRLMRRESVSSAPRQPDSGLLRQMTGQSWPLMLNHFLATIFFQIDVVILEALRGARIVGQYSVAYRWLLALNVIPAFFTQALLPVMSRQWREDHDALRRTYTLGVKILVALAIPLAVAFTFLAEFLTLFLGGAAFMPAGAIALQIMIWSIPFGWMNSLTQYALIAVDLQRMITRAFVVAVTFNIVTNLIFIPRYGYQAAAVTTILSEIVLLLPFAVLMQSALGRLRWLDMVWRPVVAGAAMGAVIAVLWASAPVAALLMGGAVYLGLLWRLRPLNAAEWGMLAPVLPRRLHFLAGG